jgi:aminoglycoside phosphotransferase family enzyme/predicted kinase
MHFDDLIKKMKKSNFFGKNIESINTIETHISIIFLTGKYAYKMKKPVNYGFLDFSTLEKRKYFCYEELKLNKRLCPDIYLEVLPITISNNNIKLNGKGKIIDFILKMKEFPQDNIMNNLLKNKKINENDLAKINNILINFYKNSNNLDEIKKYGEINNINKNTEENFEQIKPYINLSISNETYTNIKEIVNKFINTKKYLFENRILNNKIFDCHGDLHTGNIVIFKKNIYIFDCIEFNKRFRYGDSASDIGFLSMDLDYQNFPYLSSFLIKDYIEKSRDNELLKILNFYKSYRAFVRGKIISFNLKNKNDKDYNIKLKNSKKYFKLSKYYTDLINIDLKIRKPLLLIICGLTGTGKSTLSLKMSIDYDAKLINSDIIRKKIAKIDIYKKQHNKINSGIYSFDSTIKTYNKIIKIAKNYLLNNNNVIIDATFQKNEYRELMMELINDLKINPIFIQCTAPDDIVEEWLKNRLKTRTVSDGRWEIYLHQKKNYDKFINKKNHIIIDMSKNLYEDRIKNFYTILAKIKEVLN